MNAIALLLLFGQFEVKSAAEATRPDIASRFNVRPATVAETPYQRTLRLVRAGERVKVYLTDFPNEAPGVFVCWRDAAGDLVYLREGKPAEVRRAPFPPSRTTRRIAASSADSASIGSAGQVQSLDRTRIRAPEVTFGITSGCSA